MQPWLALVMPGAQPKTLLQTLFSGRILRQNRHISPWLRLVFDRTQLPFSWIFAMSEMRKPFAPSRRITTRVCGTPAKYINFNLFWIAAIPRLNKTYAICTVQIPVTVLLALGLCSHRESLYHRPWNASLIESNKVAVRAAASPGCGSILFPHISGGDSNCIAGESNRDRWKWGGWTWL